MRWKLAVLLLGLGACSRDASEPEPPAPGSELASVREWMTNPTAGVRTSGGASLRVETGPHTLLLPADARAWTPPYTIRARMRKLRGRLNEGYGLVFGGENLASPEEQQAYSYFLVRGDGSYLIKQRTGATTRVVRDWTNDPAIPRDTEEGGQPVELAVHVGTDRVRFVVGDQEVASVPATELRTQGQVGARVAHGVELAVDNFRVSQGD